MWWLVVSPHLPHQASISPPTVRPPVGAARPWLQETPVIRRSPTVDAPATRSGVLSAATVDYLGQQRRQPLDVDHAPAQRAVDLHLLAGRQRRVHLAVAPPEPLDTLLRGDDQIPLLFPFLRRVNLERHVAQLVGDLVYGWHVLRVGHCFPRLPRNCNGLRPRRSSALWGRRGQGHSRTVASLVVCGTCSALLGPRGCQRVVRIRDRGRSGDRLRAGERRRATGRARGPGGRTDASEPAFGSLAARDDSTAAATVAPAAGGRGGGRRAFRARSLRRAARERERLAGAGRRGHLGDRRRADPALGRAVAGQLPADARRADRSLSDLDGGGRADQSPAPRAAR